MGAEHRRDQEEGWAASGHPLEALAPPAAGTWVMKGQCRGSVITGYFQGVTGYRVFSCYKCASNQVQGKLLNIYIYVY